MKFASVQWGLPNLGVVVALATLPVVSLALPERLPVSTPAYSDEFAESRVWIAIQTIEMATSGDPSGHCQVMPQ